METPAQAAERILLEHRNRATFQPLPAERLGDVDYAYAVQDELVARLLEKGQDSLAGWKIGLTTARMQKMCGVDTPIAGAIFKARVFASGASVAIDTYGRLGIESELAVRLARPLPKNVGPTPDIVRACLDGVCAAFELVDDRGADYARLDACSLVADNSWNAGLVHGRFVAAKDVGDILGREGVLACNGVVIGQGLTDDVLGDPLSVVAWLETHLRSKGRALAAGEWVSTGSIVPTHFAERGKTYAFEIAGLSTVEVSVV
jgi:2-keto-4-pentenoate hydratase